MSAWVWSGVLIDRGEIGSAFSMLGASHGHTAQRRQVRYHAGLCEDVSRGDRRRGGEDHLLPSDHNDEEINEKFSTVTPWFEWTEVTITPC